MIRISKAQINCLTEIRQTGLTPSNALYKYNRRTVSTLISKGLINSTGERYFITRRGVKLLDATNETE